MKKMIRMTERDIQNIKLRIIQSTYNDWCADLLGIGRTEYRMFDCLVKENNHFVEIKFNEMMKKYGYEKINLLTFGMYLEGLI